MAEQSQQKSGWWLGVKIGAWLAGLYLSTYFYFHTIYFIVSGFVFMFSNLGKRQPGTLSAYSVFNDNCERLQGTMDPNAMFGTRPSDRSTKTEVHLETSPEEQLKQREHYFKNESKHGNQPCYCGSGSKFKKCCLPAQKKRQEQQRKKRRKGE